MMAYVLVQWVSGKDAGTFGVLETGCMRWHEQLSFDVDGLVATCSGRQKRGAVLWWLNGEPARSRNTVGRYSRPLQVIHLDICFLCHYTIGVSFIKGRLCRQGTLVNGRVLRMPNAIRPSQLEFDRLKHSKPKCTCTSKDLDSRSPFSTADSERSRPSHWTLSSQKFLEKMSLTDCTAFINIYLQ